MEPVIIAVIVAAALACPVLMCGPMLLRRFGLMKGAGSDMSCIGMMQSRPSTQDQQVKELKAKREEIDREITEIEASLDRHDGERQAHSSAPSAPDPANRA